MRQRCCARCVYFSKVDDNFSTGTCDIDDVIEIVVASDLCTDFEAEEDE